MPASRHRSRSPVMACAVCLHVTKPVRRAELKRAILRSITRTPNANPHFEFQKTAIPMTGGHAAESAIAAQVAEFLCVPFQEVMPPNMSSGVNIQF
jgi:hypothetical protein